MATRSKRTRSAALAAAGDAHGDFDFPMHMDPSLMTERQQLAFLLRKTAQENGQDASALASASAASSASSASESSDDDAPRRSASKKPRRAPTAQASSASRAWPKSPPPATREDLIAAALKNPAGLVLYCGRGRPPKNAIKLAPGEEMPPDLKKLVETAAPLVRRRGGATSDADGDELRVKMDAHDENGDKDQASERNTGLRGGATASRDKSKTSPSSASELSQHLRDAYEDRRGAGDFALGVAPPCVLCCRVNSPFDAPLDALFLCPTCDRKYPTQRALGLV